MIWYRLLSVVEVSLRKKRQEMSFSNTMTNMARSSVLKRSALQQNISFKGIAEQVQQRDTALRLSVAQARRLFSLNRLLICSPICKCTIREAKTCRLVSLMGLKPVLSTRCSVIIFRPKMPYFSAPTMMQKTIVCQQTYGAVSDVKRVITPDTYKD